MKSVNYLTGLNAIKQFKFLILRKQTFVVLEKQQVMLPYFHPNHAKIVYYFHPNHTNQVYYWLLPATLQATDAVQKIHPNAYLPNMYWWFPHSRTNGSQLSFRISNRPS